MPVFTPFHCSDREARTLLLSYVRLCNGTVRKGLISRVSAPRTRSDVRTQVSIMTPHFRAALFFAFALIGCGGVTSTDSGGFHDGSRDAGTHSTGGATATGSAPGTGNGPSSGGKPGSGGTPATGGVGNGGAPATGGSPTGGSAGACNSMTCSTYSMFNCCGDSCVNFENDPHNCGECGHVCPVSAPVCSGRQCIVPPCTLPPNAGMCAPTSICCGDTCCASNEICCHFSSGLPIPGPNIGCVNPLDSGGTCPLGCPSCICASPDTPIATPNGDSAIASLRVGDPVFSVDHGQVVVVPIAEVRTRAAANHYVVRVELARGAVLEISARHPTADGRTFGDLRSGGRLGEIEIKSATVVPYQHPFTYDILPASDSGTYFAGGALIGSTLKAETVLQSAW